jgi:autotransporter strand-loop-strand O-heptosyltransferase
MLTVRQVAISRLQLGGDDVVNVAVEPRRVTDTVPPCDDASADQFPSTQPGSPHQSASAEPSSSGGDKPPYPTSAWPPTQEGPKGLRFDFNDGTRVALPEAKSPWRVRLSDLDTGNILYDTTIAAGRVASAKRYWLPIRIEVWQDGAIVFTHDYSAADRDVLILFPVGTLGDTLGWFPYAVKFKNLHKCRLACAMSEKMIPLFRDTYPDIAFMTLEEIKPERYYATYRMGLFFDDKACVQQPCDFRHVGLHRTAGYILGVDPKEERPRISIPASDDRPIAEPYVCIGVQASTQAKKWNNPDGWLEIVRFLKAHGYRVVCVDQRRTHGAGLAWAAIPHGADDRTGLALPECARLLRHADFFVGLSSGLSWLAWAVGARVVMISGFSHPSTEFETPWRVINYHTCNSCWNDPAHRFDHKDFLWCPRHKDTPRQFECTRLITVDHVKKVLRKLPNFGADIARGSAS